MNKIENTCLLAGRFLMGMYFILPGIGKITGFEATVEYMAVHNVPMITPLLIFTIILQLGCGAALIAGFKAKYAAFILAGLTLVISLFMHNFWTYVDGMEKSHETQNFFKNMGIVAGLLMVVGLGSGPFSLDSSLDSRVSNSSATTTSTGT